MAENREQPLGEQGIPPSNLAGLLEFTFDHLGEAAYWVDEDGRFVYVNETASRKLGYSREELLGLRLFDVALDAPVRDWPRNWSELFERGGRVFETRHRAKDGTILPVEVRIRCLEFEGRRLLCGLAMDLTDKQESERLLRESERHRHLAQLTLDRSTEPAFWLGRDGRLLYVNSAACRSLGYTREELLELSISDIDPRFRDESWDEHWAKLSGRGPATVESTHQRKDGSRFPVEVFINTVEFEGEQYHFSFTRDITARKVAEAERRFRAEFERLVTTISTRFINLSPDAIEGEIGHAIREIGEFAGVDRSYLFLFSEDHSRMRCVTEWRADGVPGPTADAGDLETTPFAWLLGKLRRAEAFVVASITEIPESENEIRETFEALGMRSVVDVPVFRRDRLVGFLGLAMLREERTWPDGTITLLRMLAEIVGNALDRKSMETALGDSEAKLREVVKHAPIVLWAFDGDGVFTFSEGRGLKSIGLRGGEVVGRSVFDVYRGNERVLEDARRAMRGEVVRSLTFVEDKAFEVHYAPLFDEEGLPSGAIGVATDVTERRHAEEERRQLEAMLRQSQKMEAVGQLAGGIAHDFNNLLQAMRGYAALGRRLADGKVRGYLDEILRASDRAGDLVRQLLTFSRREALRFEFLSLNDVVTGLMKMLRRLIGEHLELDIHTASGIGTIEGDRGQVEQILMNLCVNARDAMSGGGRLRIETGTVRFTEADLTTRPWARAGEFVRLRVTDSGCGIPPEVRERIFEPFFTTKEMGHGTGLGLATVYAITERHQGFLNVESEPGQGASLEVYFPVRQRPARAATDGGGEADSEGGSGTILLAEDDDQVAELGRTILEDAGYHVLLARDGREAIDLLGRHADEITAAVLDVVMPGKSGRAVYDEIVRTRPGVPVLFTTGYSGDALATEGLPEDAFEVLPKPFGPRELLARVRALLAD